MDIDNRWERSQLVDMANLAANESIKLSPDSYKRIGEWMQEQPWAEEKGTYWVYDSECMDDLVMAISTRELDDTLDDYMLDWATAHRQIDLLYDHDSTPNNVMFQWIGGDNATQVDLTTSLSPEQLATVMGSSDMHYSIRKAFSLVARGDTHEIVPSFMEFPSEVMPMGDRKLEPLALTHDMVAVGVIDADTQKRVTLNTGAVTIPSTIITAGIRQTPIASISSDAFWGCDNIKSITVPTSVTRIEDRAFADLRNLTTLNLPDNGIVLGHHLLDMEHLDFDRNLREFIEELDLPDDPLPKHVHMPDSAIAQPDTWDGCEVDFLSSADGITLEETMRLLSCIPDYAFQPPKEQDQRQSERVPCPWAENDDRDR